MMCGTFVSYWMMWLWCSGVMLTAMQPEQKMKISSSEPFPLLTHTSCFMRCWISWIGVYCIAILTVFLRRSWGSGYLPYVNTWVIWLMSWMMVVCVACLKIVSRNLCGGSEVLCPSSSTRQNNGQMQWCDTKHQKYSGGHSRLRWVWFKPLFAIRIQTHTWLFLKPFKRGNKRFHLKNEGYEKVTGCLQQTQGVEWFYYPALWLLDQIKGLMPDYNIHLVWWWASLQIVGRRILSRMLLNKHRQSFHTIDNTIDNIVHLYSCWQPLYNQLLQIRDIHFCEWSTKTSVWWRIVTPREKISTYYRWFNEWCQ